ncbi:MAG: tetratricopeptide (TPR) repeat protein [Reinekea sp.]|jgi:tetratricopeptide (TPR) repeat protein
MLTAMPALGCDWQSQIAHITATHNEGEPFIALAELDPLILQCPDAARLYLEKGSILYSLKRYEAAISVWQFALENYSLPENVILKVRLKIIDAEQKHKQLLNHLLLARTTVAFQMPAQATVMNWSFQGKTRVRLPAINIQQSPLFPELYVGYGGLLRQQNSKTETLGLLQLGANGHWKNWQAPLSFNMIMMSARNTYNATFKPSVTWNDFTFSSAATYYFSDQQWKFEPKVRQKQSKFDSEISAVYQNTWQSLNGEFNYGQRWRFGVFGHYSLNSHEHSIGTNIQARLSTSFKLSLKTTIDPLTPTNWSTRLGVDWKVY